MRETPPNLLTTALVGALLPADVPEGHMVRSWLDSWDGVGHVVDAMRASGYNVRLFRSPFCWWAEFCRDRVNPVSLWMGRTRTRRPGRPSSEPRLRRCGSRSRTGEEEAGSEGGLYGADFCLYALQATIPLLPAKQRPGHPADWMETDTRVTCPDPACRLIMRIERVSRRVLRHDDVSAVPLTGPRLQSTPSEASPAPAGRGGTRRAAGRGTSRGTVKPISRAR